MDEIAREYDSVDDVRNFLRNERTVKFLQNDAVLFFKVEGYKTTDQSDDDDDDIAPQSYHEGVKKFIDALNPNEIKKLNKTVQEIDGFSIRFGVTYFSSSFKQVINQVELENQLDENLEKLEERINSFVDNGSGWIYEGQIETKYRICFINPFRRSGGTYIKLPEKFKNTKSCINIQNIDNKCFLWCHACHILHIKTNETIKNPFRVLRRYKEIAKTLNYEGINFPVTYEQIPKIEKQNKISVFVFEYDEDKDIKYPTYRSSKKYPDTLALLRITGNGKNETLNGTSHYVYIKNTKAFFADLTKNNSSVFVCIYCGKRSEKLETHLNHEKRCFGEEYTPELILPNKKNRDHLMTFKNFDKMIPLPFMIVADFESYTNPVHSATPSIENSFTVVNQLHSICSYGLKLVCNYDDNFSKPVEIYRGPDVIFNFLCRIIDLNYECNDIFEKHFKKELNLTPEEQKSFNEATKCIYCKRMFNKKCRIWTDRTDEKPKFYHDFCKRQLKNIDFEKLCDDDSTTDSTDIDLKNINKIKCVVCNKGFREKARDHCHATGKYRGAAHIDCNINARLRKFIPVIMHNGKNYDWHFIIKGLTKVIKEKYKDLIIGIIPLNYEKFITINIKLPKSDIYIVFLDSLNFLLSSLEKLANDLEPEDFVFTNQLSTNTEFVSLLKQKGVYPYDYMNSPDKLTEKSLPPRSAFYSILRDGGISEAEYEHAKKVWSVGEMKTLADYHDWYLKTDVSILSDVFTKFRKTTIEKFGLDPLHYLTLPALSFDCLFKSTGATVELITEAETYEYF